MLSTSLLSSKVLGIALKSLVSITVGSQLGHSWVTVGSTVGSQLGLVFLRVHRNSDKKIKYLILLKGPSASTDLQISRKNPDLTVT